MWKPTIRKWYLFRQKWYIKEQWVWPRGGTSPYIDPCNRIDCFNVTSGWIASKSLKMILSLFLLQLVDTVKIIYLLKKIGRHWKAVPRMRKASTLPRKQPGSWSRTCQVTNKHSTWTNSIEGFPTGRRVEQGDAWQTSDRSSSLLRELACARFSDSRDVAKIKQANRK